MTSRLTWCEAPRGCGCVRNHRQDLQSFVCVEPAPRGVLPKHRNVVSSRWARQVQSGIRNIKPPVANSDLLLLGFDNEGLAVVSHSFELEPGKVKILAIARALRCRGLGYGDLIMDETLERIPTTFDSSPGEDYLIVEGIVHRENVPSQALLDRQQFFYYGDDGVEQDWFLRIDLVDQE